MSEPQIAGALCVVVCRWRVRDGKVERAAWSPTGTNRFDDVMKFGEVYIK